MRKESCLLSPIVQAKKDDLPEILALQRLCYQSESALLHNSDIPPLRQTLEEIQTEFENGMILKVCDQTNQIIGSVRAHSTDGTLFIGKLFVHPVWQGNGVGSNLLREIEHICPHNRCELFTSSKSVGNIVLYERLGYRIYQQKVVSDGLVFVYLEK